MGRDYHGAAATLRRANLKARTEASRARVSALAGHTPTLTPAERAAAEATFARRYGAIPASAYKTPRNATDSDAADAKALREARELLITRYALVQRAAPAAWSEEASDALDLVASYRRVVAPENRAAYNLDGHAAGLHARAAMLRHERRTYTAPIEHSMGIGLHRADVDAGNHSITRQTNTGNDRSVAIPPLWPDGRGVVTHNHTGGGSFSADDLGWFANSGASELRAVGRSPNTPVGSMEVHRLRNDPKAIAAAPTPAWIGAVAAKHGLTAADVDAARTRYQAFQGAGGWATQHHIMQVKALLDHSKWRPWPKSSLSMPLVSERRTPISSGWM